MNEFFYKILAKMVMIRSQLLRQCALVLSTRAALQESCIACLVHTIYYLTLQCIAHVPVLTLYCTILAQLQLVLGIMTIYGQICHEYCSYMYMCIQLALALASKCLQLKYKVN